MSKPDKMNRNFDEKFCLYCRKEIRGHHYNRGRKFCSIQCRRDNYNKGMLGLRAYELSTGTVGAISELTVSLDLLKKGYEVYRSLSPSCSGDLLTEKDNIFYKIEVRTSRINRVTKKWFSAKTNIRCKILALVALRENKIKYCEYPSMKEIRL